jgi:hypothetical protein
MPITLDGTNGITTPMYNGSITANAVTPVTGFKNRIINGQMTFDQRNAGASVTLTSADTYTLDRWQFGSSQSSKYSCQQNAGSVTPPVGYGNYLGITSLSAYTVGSAETFNLIQRIEGFNTADLNWGTANAKTVTLSFQVYSSLTGTFGGAITNSAFNYSYPFTYSIPTANTWTQISVTIAGPTAGTWIGATNGAGLVLRFSMGTGSTLSGTAGAWSASGLISATGATSVVGTNGATFYITGVQLEVGSTATSFDYRPYGTELSLCQRYYAKMSTGGYSNYTAFASGVATATNSGNLFFKYPVTMRASATIAYSNVAYSYAAGTLTAVSSSGATYAGTDSMLAQPVATGASMTIGYACILMANNNSAGYIELNAEL